MNVNDKINCYKKVFENVYESMEKFGDGKYVYGFGYLESLIKDMLEDFDSMSNK